MAIPSTPASSGNNFWSHNHPSNVEMGYRLLDVALGPQGDTTDITAECTAAGLSCFAKDADLPGDSAECGGE